MIWNDNKHRLATALTILITVCQQGSNLQEKSIIFDTCFESIVISKTFMNEQHFRFIFIRSSFSGNETNFPRASIFIERCTQIDIGCNINAGFKFSSPKFSKSINLASLPLNGSNTTGAIFNGGNCRETLNYFIRTK